MARKPRFNLPGIPQHVIQRGNNRNPCFFNEADYQRYLDDLAEAAKKSFCNIHAYVLMTNHVHLLVTPMSQHGVSEMMQSLGRRYVRYINQTYNRSGTLWEGRFKASLVDSERYLLACMRYIELNPVRAGMVSHPGEYEWTSYHGNGQHGLNALLSSHPVYHQLANVAERRQVIYRELFGDILDDGSIHEIREALNHELVLGRSSFKEKIKLMTSRQVDEGNAGRPCVEEEAAGYYVMR